MPPVLVSLPSARIRYAAYPVSLDTAASASSPPTATPVARASARARLGPVTVAEAARDAGSPVPGSIRCGPRSYPPEVATAASERFLCAPSERDRRAPQDQGAPAPRT